MLALTAATPAPAPEPCRWEATSVEAIVRSACAGTVRYAASPALPGAFVVGHMQSGQVNSFSPDGRWMGMLVAPAKPGPPNPDTGSLEDQWYLLETQTGEIRSAFPRSLEGAAHNSLQWTPDGLLMRILPRSGVIEFWNPATRTTVATIPLPRPPAVSEADVDAAVRWRRWGSVDASGQRLLAISHLTGLVADDPDRTRVRSALLVIDSVAREIVHGPYPFDDRVHRGEARVDGWHHLFLAGDWFYTTLSGRDREGGAPPHAHFRFAPDGTGWDQISNLGPEKDANRPETLSQSHVVYDGGLGAFGFERYVWVWDPVEKRGIRRFNHGLEDQGGYGHANLDAERGRLLYSFAKWYEDVGDVRLYAWDWQTSETPVVVAEVRNELALGVARRARPFLSPDGRTAVWHEGRKGDPDHVELVMKPIDEIVLAGSTPIRPLSSPASRGFSCSAK